MKKFYSLFLVLAAMTMSVNALEYYDSTSKLNYDLDADALTATVVGHPSYASLTTISIPQSLNYNAKTYAVVLGESAFENCTNLKNVEFDSDMEYEWVIGNKAFAGCNNITWVEFSGDSICIGDSAFAGCSKMAFDASMWHEFKSIGNYAFENCTSTGDAFKEIVVGFKLVSIGENAFKGCTAVNKIFMYAEELSDYPTSYSKSPFYGLGNGILNIVLFEKVKYIPNGLFYGMKNAEFVLEANSGKGMFNLKEIGADAFSGCIKMTDEIIGKLFTDALTAVGNGAFDGCSAVTELVLPKNLSDIEGYAFSGMTNLKTVYAMRPTPPVISESVFSGCGDLSKIDLKVTDATYAAYSTANVWKEFNVVPDGGFWKLTITDDGHVESVKVIDANTEVELDPDKIANNTTVKFVVSPKEGYKEAYAWEYGHGLTLTVLKNQTILATTEIIKFNIQALNDGNGTVSVKKGGDNFVLNNGNLIDYFTEMEFTAVPNEGFKFKQWNDGNTDNPRSFTICEANRTGTYDSHPQIKYTARFEKDSSTGVDNLQGGGVQCTKLICNGQLLIERDGKTFNALGTEVK